MQTGIKRLVGDDYVNRNDLLCCSQQSDFSIIEITIIVINILRQFDIFCLI